MAVDLEFDFAEAIKKIDIFSQADFNKLREWTRNLDKSKCVPKNLSDKQILLFYNACFGDIEKSKICIEKYYLFRKNAPEFFDNRDLSAEALKHTAEVLEFSFLPEKSVEGYDIIFHRLHHTEPSKYHFENGCKMLFMTVDACLNKRGPQPGYMFLFDMRGVRLGHITKLSWWSLRKFFQYVQEAMPVRMRAVHVLNTEPVLDKLMLLIKPFMDKKFYDIIKFHNKNEDLEEFYEKVIPRRALPPDYGGELPDTQTLHARCLQELRSLHNHFESEEEQRKRAIEHKKNGLENFGDLTID